MIIVVDSDLTVAKQIAAIFYKMGFHSIATDFDNLDEHIYGEKFECVLIADADRTPDPYNFALDFKKAHEGIPLIILRSKESKTNKYLLEAYYDDVLYENSYSTTIVDNIMSHWYERTGDDFSIVRAGGAKIDYTSPFAFFMGIPLNVTPTERMIIKYLILTSPRKIPAEELMRSCFHPMREREKNNISTHISVINKKALAECGKKIIAFSRGEGYYIPVKIKERPDYRENFTEEEIRFYELQYEEVRKHIL